MQTEKRETEPAKTQGAGMPTPLDDCERLLYEYQARTFVQQNRINELESHVVYLQQKAETLHLITSSRSWRSVQKWGGHFNRLFPRNSARRNVFSVLGHGLLKMVQGLMVAMRTIRSVGWFSRLVPLAFPAVDAPLVSIIVPVYNQFRYTYGCLASVLHTCEDISYEVIVADDNSKDKTKKIHRKVTGIRVVRNEQNLGFLRNCNHAAQQAHGKYLVFLNNDTTVRAGWLQSLVQLAERDEKCGVAGSKILFADGLLQEAGGIIWRDGSAWNYGRREAPTQSAFNYVKEVDYVSGCSLLVRRQLWNEVGGFDERFAPAYCEDSDLAFAARAQGYKVMYQPASEVVHFEGVSNGTDLAAGIKQYQRKNQEKLYEKWKKQLEQHCPNGEQVFCARDRSVGKPCVVIFDFTVPTFDQDAGSRTVFEYTRLFLHMGYNVKFLPDNVSAAPKYVQTLQQMGVEVLDPNPAVWKEWLYNNGKYIQYAFLNRPGVSIKYISQLRQHTAAKIIYYGHDLHFLREQRQYEVTGNTELLSSARQWKAIEMTLLRESDISYYPSGEEIRHIHKIDSSIKAKEIPAYIFNEVPQVAYSTEKRNGLLFVGGFGHEPNADAVLWFAERIWPAIYKENPNITINIVGSKITEAIQALDSPRFHICGFVPDEELRQLYLKARISVAPLRYGAGLKGKIIEALKNGLPVITTTVGAEGINGAANFMMVQDEAEEFAKSIVQLYSDEQELRRMSADGCKFVRNNFGTQKAYEMIKDDFA